MSGEEYTPTTVDVATAYQVAGAMRGDYPAQARAGAHYRPEFDRWLAEHVAANARAVREAVAEQLERAQFVVESTHHIHGTICLCGFDSHGRARSVTEHITQALDAASIARGGTTP